MTFRTLKYRPGYPYKGFASIDEARKCAMTFVDWYNNHHHHSGKAQEIISNREMVYDAARQRNPKRWTSDLRNWRLRELVALNSTDEVKTQLKQAENSLI
jgi:putative transposase